MTAYKTPDGAYLVWDGRREVYVERRRDIRTAVKQLQTWQAEDATTAAHERAAHLAGRQRTINELRG